MKKAAYLLLCLIVSVGIAWGQGAVGTLNGTILDTSGAVIPGATVVATDVATGVETRTTTTSAGSYTLPYLPAGTYNIRVSAPGFRTTDRNDVILRVGQVMTVNINLEVGAVTEEVTVSAAPPLLESGTAEIGRYINNEEYQNWPIMVGDGQRQIQDFIFSSLPGTTGGTFQGSINGGQQYSHEILIEGIPVGRSDLSGGNNNEMSPSAEAIGDFKLHTGAMGAQYNGGQTAVANFAIKSGTNQLHGTAFYYVQNDAFNANTYSNNSRGISEKSKRRQNNYGFSVGGPIYIPKVVDGRNKAFFFVNFERTINNNFSISGMNTTLPTSDFKQGNFTRLFDPNFTGNASSGTVVGQDSLGRNVVFGQLYDPLSTRLGPDGNPVRDPFAGNIIPKSRWSNVADNIVNQVGIVDPELNTMINNTPSIGTCCPFFRLWSVGIKGDVNVTDAHRLSGYYNHEYRIRNNSPGGRYAPVPGLPTGVFQDQYTPSRMVRLSLNSTLAPTILNRIAAGYNRFRNTNESVYVDQDWASKVGVKNTSPSHFPRMNFSGNEWQGGRIFQIGSSAAGGSFNGSWVVQDDLTIIHGAHTFRIGYDYRKYYYNERNKNGSGNYNFTPTETGLTGYSSQTGHAFASFLLGAIHSAGRGVSVLYSGFRQSEHAFYFMDDWKATPKLTINMGLRWEVIPGLWEVTGRMSEVDLNLPNPAAEGRLGAIKFGGPFQDTNWTQIGPRIGFAYQLNEKMVVRAGYGITNMPNTRNDWGYGAFTTGYSASIPINAGTSPTGFADDPAAWLDDPYPNLEGELPNMDPGQQLYTGKSTTSPKSTRLPYTQNWNVTLQYQLPHQFVLETAYVGNKGTRLRHSFFGRLNDLPTDFLQLGNVLRRQVGDYPSAKPYPSFPDGQSVAQALRAYPQYTGLAETFPYNSNSFYNSLQVTLTRHFSNGLGVLAAYTWSKAITESDNAISYGWSGQSQDIFNRRLERSLAIFNRPHVFRLTWLYEIPVGKGKRWDLGGWNYLIGGWTFSAIHNYSSGGMIGIGQSGIHTPAGFGHFRPDVTGAKQTVGGAPEDLDFFVGTPYLDPKGFAESPRTDEGVPIRVGTAPRALSHITSPHSLGERFRLVKVIPIWESVEFEFGFAATNPFNRHGRRIMSTNVSSANFGKMLVQGGGQRVIQLEGRFRW